MALTTAERIALLEEALASATLSARYGDRGLQYRPIAEIKEALAYLRQAERTASGRGAVSVSIASFWRG